MQAKLKVLDFIDKNFDISEIKLKDFKYLPGGTIVVDKDKKEMIVFYDLLNDKVKYTFPEDEKIYIA